MNNNFGLIGVIPILITLTITFFKKDIMKALLLGIISGMGIIWFYTKQTSLEINIITSVFSNISTLKTISFILLIGALVYVIECSGGVEGAVIFMTEKRSIVKNKLSAQLLTQLTGLLLFVDSTSSIIVSSLIGRPFFNKYNVPKEKLALIANSTAAPIAWLIPFGGAGALTAAIINGIDGIKVDGFSYVISAVGFQFYTIVILLIILSSIIFNFEIGGMKELTNNQTTEEIKSFNTNIPKGKQPLFRNMLVPISCLMIFIFAIMYVTGNKNILLGDGSSAVFTSGIITLITTGIYYTLQGITTPTNYISMCFKGMKNVALIVLILILSFIFSNTLEVLQTANYISNIINFVPSSIIPICILIISSIIAFSTGTSSGTVAILTPLIIPLAMNIGVSIPLTLGAIISGAVFGDQNSPISDSVILTSTATEVDIMTHVKTQLPYTITALAIAAMLYLVMGFII